MTVIWPPTVVQQAGCCLASTDRYPCLIVGERDCPSKYCGGILGCYEMFEARADPTHADHTEISKWIEGYDPDALGAIPIQIALGRIAARRKAIAKRVMKSADD